MNYFDEKGIIKLSPTGPHPVENTPLFHWTLCTNFRAKGLAPVLSEEYSLSKYINFENGNVGEDLANGRSHDNMSAAVVLTKMAYGKPLKELNVYQYLHPRDIIYFFRTYNPYWYTLICLVLIGLPEIILFLVYFYMAIRKYKYRNGVKVPFLKTDTEILYALRMMVEPKLMRIFYKMTIDRLLIRKFQTKQWYHRALEIYYRDTEHPVVLSAKELRF